MINNEKIGVGIVTYNRLDGLQKLYKSLPLDIIDELIIINDGDFFESTMIDSKYIIHNSENIGVGKSKNKIFKCFQEKNIDHFFILEDDIFLLDRKVFSQYIQSAKVTGIQHFNYAHHQSRKIAKALIEYPRNIRVQAYQNCYAAFSYYTKFCIQEVGIMDEEFYNALEHVDHTLEISHHQLHPEFYDFMDIEDSFLYISDYYQEQYKSVISTNKKYNSHLENAHQYFLEKHHIKVNDIQPIIFTELIKQLQFIYNNYAEEGIEFSIYQHNFDNMRWRVFKEMKQQLRRKNYKNAELLKNALIERSSIFQKVYYVVQWWIRKRI